METCNICTEKFNKSTRTKIPCEYCNLEACSACCRRWVLDGATPKCMNNACDRTWTRKFISAQFPKSFINTELKTHRENLLFQQETALLPETQPYVEEEIHKETINNQINDLKRQQTQLELQISNLRTDLWRNRPTTERREFVRECPGENCRGFLSTAWKCGLCEKWTCPDCHEVKGTNRDTEHTCNPDSVATAQLLARDTKPCPKCRTGIFKIDGCFAENTEIICWDGSIKLSQDIKIGDKLIGDDGNIRTVLNTVSGIDELYEVNQNKGIKYVVNSKHKMVLLKDDTIYEISIYDYIKLINDEKDKYMGFKTINGEYEKTSLSIKSIGSGKYYGWEIDSNHRFILSDFTVVRNCDQMWCTQCHTGFNWRTGRIETNVHNPHFFEWQRRNAVNGEIPRTQGDQPQEQCRNIDHNTSRYILNMIQSSQISEEMKGVYRKLISKLVRMIVHIRETELQRYIVNYATRNRHLRIRYMRNRITEATFKTFIQRYNKKYEKNEEIRNVYELLLNTVSDIIYRVHSKLNDRNPEFFEPLQEIHAIVEYTNECFREIGKTYISRPIQYDDELSLL